MFILSSISSELELLSVNHTSIYKNSESKVFKNINLKIWVKIWVKWTIVDQMIY